MKESGTPFARANVIRFDGYFSAPDRASLSGHPGRFRGQMLGDGRKRGRGVRTCTAGRAAGRRAHLRLADRLELVVIERRGVHAELAPLLAVQRVGLHGRGHRGPARGILRGGGGRWSVGRGRRLDGPNRQPIPGEPPNRSARDEAEIDAGK